MNKKSSVAHLRFYRAGALNQYRIDSGADIEALHELDRKLWVALACPVKGLEFDEQTLALIDTDNDGRVRAPEVLAAVEFLQARLKTMDTLLAGDDALALSAIDDATREGQAALASARRILGNLGRSDASTVGVADIAEPEKFFAGTRFNGDGVVTPQTAEDGDTAAVIQDIMTTQGTTADRSGDDGASRAAIESFFAEAKALAAWLEAGDDGGDSSDSGLAKLGGETAAAFEAVSAVHAKVEDYYTRTRLAAFDERALDALNRSADDYLELSRADLATAGTDIASFPLARIEANRPLPLHDGLNPAWAAAVETLYAKVVHPLFGAQDALTASQWHELNDTLAPYAAWFNTQPAAHLDTLDHARVRAITASDAETRILDLLAQDEALTEETNGVDAVVKLVRLNRDLVQLLHNFVSFSDFYAAQRMAIFQCGQLFLDSRECKLCVHVDNVKQHAVLAALSKCCLAYCTIKRARGAETQTIVAVFSQGDSDYLTAGRNGLFIDRKGQDWDATIIRIVDAPISIRQAFFAPYKKFLRMVEDQTTKRAQAADKAASGKMSAGAGTLAHADKTKPKSTAAATPASTAPSKIDLGTIALIGTAISGVAAIVGLLLQSFWELGVYMPVGLLAILLLISGPSMLIAAIKLHYRSLGPILDASGWAVNGRVHINIPFGTALTGIATLPRGSQLDTRDPFRPKTRRWPVLVAILIIIACASFITYDHGWLNGWLPGKLQHPAASAAGATAATAAKQPPAAPAK